MKNCSLNLNNLPFLTNGSFRCYIGPEGEDVGVNGSASVMKTCLWSSGEMQVLHISIYGKDTNIPTRSGPMLLLCNIWKLAYSSSSSYWLWIQHTYHWCELAKVSGSPYYNHLETTGNMSLTEDMGLGWMFICYLMRALCINSCVLIPLLLKT